MKIQNLKGDVLKGKTYTMFLHLFQKDHKIFQYSLYGLHFEIIVF